LKSNRHLLVLIRRISLRPAILMHLGAYVAVLCVAAYVLFGGLNIPGPDQAVPAMTGTGVVDQRIAFPRLLPQLRAWLGQHVVHTQIWQGILQLEMPVLVGYGGGDRIAWAPDGHPLERAVSFLTHVQWDDPRSILAAQVVPLAGLSPAPPVPDGFLPEPAEVVPAEEQIEVIPPPDEPAEPGLQVLVGIYHTHATESFLPAIPGASGKPLNQAYSDDPSRSVIAVGKALAEALQARGVGAIHSERQHDLMEGFSRSYINSRVTAEQMCAEHDLVFLFDIHRDALKRSQSVAQINGETVAKISIVVGLGQMESNPHPHWKQNWNLALRLANAMEQKYPGLSGGIIPKPFVYNQDLSPHALLLEVGGPENTLAEECRAVQLLADVLVEMIKP
jgi:stage II sporulation protein P